MRRALLLLLALGVAGCGSTPKQEAKAPTEFELLNRSAQAAFSRGRYAQAATLYQATLDQALIQDEPTAIVDARFNLALSYTYLGRYQRALDLVTLAEAERVRRALGHDPELQLLRATIHYRAGDAAAAQRQLDALLTDTTLSAAASEKVRFLAGVIAADRGDASTLRQQRNALPAGDDRDGGADRLELDGRLAALEGDTDEALRRLERAALVRSRDGDYRGMTRALVVAAAVAERSGRAELAAAYWLRAGRSGAQRAEPDARAWLERARALGERTGDGVLVLEVEALLAKLVAVQQPR